MAIKTIKPRSSGKRSVVLVNYKKHLTNGVRPTKNLIKNIHNQSGRNNQGKITVRQQAGGNQRKYRDIDFKRKVFNIPAVVKTIEYDPNRTSFICLIAYANGLKSYIIAPKDIKVGDTIINADVADIKIGNCMKVGNIPEGTFVHNVELIPGNGGILARGAGTSVQVLGKDETGKFTVLKLASGETRKTPNDSLATIGLVSNEDHNIINLGKAGKSRHLGIKPTVRGSAMNPIDHPHGGGEGRQGIGRDAPRSPWGKRLMGVKTRRHNRPSNSLIMRRRNGKTL